MKGRGGASFAGMVLTRVTWVALLWWALAGGGAWAFGAAAIALAVAASLALQPTPRVRISLPALFPFLTFFALRSVHAGFDVARRALSPRLPIAPSLVDLRLRLPPGPSRVFLAARHSGPEAMA